MTNIAANESGQHTKQDPWIGMTVQPPRLHAKWARTIERGRRHGWVERDDVDAGARPGTTTDERAEMIRLRREVGELRRVNDIVKSASAISAAAELDRRPK